MNYHAYKVLCIDDDAQIRQLTVKALVQDQHKVVEASSGGEGIEKAIQTKPDLIILDVMMPGMNGFEACRQLRSNPKTAHIPIIMLTALGDLGDQVHALENGADDYIIKPFVAEALRARVQAHLRRSARDLSANPLTSLPGNRMIEQIIQRRIEQQIPMAVLYFDLSDFKSFNDEYGWLKGDSVIQLLGRIIVETVEAEGNDHNFVGHVGGDDFIAVTAPEQAEDTAQRIIARFDKEILEWYSEEARARGYIEAIDRKGHLIHVPIMRLSIAIISSNLRKFQHATQVAAHAAEVKKYLKTLASSQYAFDRRAK